MSKQTDILEVIEEAREDLGYRPSRREKELKSRFWTIAADDPFFSIEGFQTKVSLERRLEAKLPNWGNPGFKEWFFNKDEYRHKVDYLFGLALDAAEEILINNDPKVQGARVQLIRALSELAGRVPHKQTQIAIQNNTHLNAAVDKMSREELEKYLTGVRPMLDASKGESK